MIREQTIGNISSFPARFDVLPDAVAALAPQVDVLNVVLNDWDGSHVQPLWGLLGKHANVAVWRAAPGMRDEAKFWRCENSAGTVFLTFDDDVTYPPDIVRVLLAGLARHPGCIVGLHGVRLAGHMPLRSYYGDSPHFPAADSPHIFHDLANDVAVDIIGCCGIAYHTREVEVRLSDFKAPGTSDIWLSCATQARGVRRWALAHTAGWCGAHPAMRGRWTLCEHWSIAAKDTEQTAAINATDWGHDVQRG